jgi:uncharacterized DUF497 family protein
MAMSRVIEWDSAKAETNYRKHGIRFEEAAWVFEDPLAISVQDRIEQGEQRWQTMGLVGGCLLLLVAHTVAATTVGGGEIEVIRIVSARRADRKERERYEQG